MDAGGVQLGPGRQGRAAKRAAAVSTQVRVVVGVREAEVRAFESVSAHAVVRRGAACPPGTISRVKKDEEVEAALAELVTGFVTAKSFWGQILGQALATTS